MNKYLTRNKCYDRLPPAKDAKKVYIYCEGEDTEYCYFEYFQELSSNISIIPIKNIKGKSDPLKLLEHAREDFLVKGCPFILDRDLNDEIWFVIDTDKWNCGDKINSLRKFCDEQNDGKYSAWKVAQSNPCFEIWQYYHVYANRPCEKDVNNCSTFKEFVNKSIPGGFDNRKKPVLIEAAINNSKTNFTMKNEQPEKYSTEVYLLGEVIYSFTKDIILNSLKFV